MMVAVGAADIAAQVVILNHYDVNFYSHKQGL
jgi:hypothetical protein